MLQTKVLSDNDEFLKQIHLIHILVKSLVYGLKNHYLSDLSFFFATTRPKSSNFEMRKKVPGNVLN